MDNAFKNLNSKIKQNLETSKSYLIDNLNSLYTIEENPSKYVT